MKPIALTRWLATLLLPPAAYAPRRLLVPFAGVMSEVIGAKLAGWECIVAIEQSEEYCEIAARRIAWWQDMIRRYGPNLGRILETPATREAAPEGQLALLEVP